MKIEPAYTSVGGLFEHKPMYFIPKYQRAYSWGKDSVNDFVCDLENVFNARKSNTPINHFFGGILSVIHPITGAVNQHKFELIDGQQRIATFNLLATSIIHHYEDLLEKMDDKNSLFEVIGKRKSDLTQRFIGFEQEVNREFITRDVLVLSKSDKDFFKDLVLRMDTSIERNSHQNLLDAYNTIFKMVRKLCDFEDGSLEEIIDNLYLIMNVIEDDFTILHMVTESKSDAFRLFQVLNDRGTNLSDGDLLRAKTLEIVEGHPHEQDSIEKLWDKILSDPPSKTASYLNWIYESYQGKRPKANVLFDKYLTDFFPESANTEVTNEEAKKVQTTVNSIFNNIINCRKLQQGEWIHDPKPPITNWDRTRLNLLLVELNHDLALPLLLAAYNLDHQDFSRIVQMLEIVFFRYKVICNQHVTPLKKIYAEEALSIRQDPASYDTSVLRNKLSDLIARKASDESFKSALVEMEYKVRNESNKPLKYFLLTIDYHYQCCKPSASASCLDKSRIYDFTGTSIEHIYPRNAPEDQKEDDLEPLRNSLGNLTIMDPAQNNSGANDSFITKKALYESSSSELTKEISKNDKWGIDEINKHRDDLINAALKIFTL